MFLALSIENLRPNENLCVEQISGSNIVASSTSDNSTARF